MKMYHKMYHVFATKRRPLVVALFKAIKFGFKRFYYLILLRREQVSVGIQDLLHGITLTILCRKSTTGE